MNKYLREKFSYPTNRIYFDNSATTQKPISVIKKISDFYSHNYGSVHRGIYESAESVTTLYENARLLVATFIGSKPNELIFTSGTTSGINFIADSWARKNLSAGDQIILTELEHNSNLVPWLRLAREKNLEIKYIPIDKYGNLDYEKYLGLLSPKVKLVSFTLSSNSLGTDISDQEAAYIIENARAVGSKIVIDGAQAIGYRPVLVNILKPDFLVFSAHKMFGPTGIGGLYISKEIQSQVEPYQVGGGMVHNINNNSLTWLESPTKYEAGTPPIAQAIGFGEAVTFIQNNLDLKETQEYLASLCKYFIKNISNNQAVKIIGPIENLERYGHLVSFTIDNFHAHDVAAFLDKYYKIEVRAGMHCSHKVFEKLNIKGTIRASFHVYNNKNEIDILIKALNDLTNKELK